MEAVSNYVLPILGSLYFLVVATWAACIGAIREDDGRHTWFSLTYWAISASIPGHALIVYASNDVSPNLSELIASAPIFGIFLLIAFGLFLALSDLSKKSKI